MKASNTLRGAVAFCAAAGFLAACGGGGQPPLAPLGQPPAPLLNTSGAATSAGTALHPDLAPSWMAPGAATKDLLYISNYDKNSVAVYSYPQDKLVGTLSGLDQPDGVCADKKGDVWIVNNDAYVYDNVVEYKHGGTAPIARLADHDQFAVSCSVDPTTGNLAVTNLIAYGGGEGTLALYRHATGGATLYSVPKMQGVYFCGYDDKGNLFVDGRDKNFQFQFDELPKGKKTFEHIQLKVQVIFPGDVVWDGKYVAVGDQEYEIVGSPAEYDSAIFRTTGAGGKTVGTTVLGDSNDVAGFTIDGKTVIAADLSPYSYPEPNNVPFYNYPAGGRPTKILSKGVDQPHGVALSVGPK
ncbi:MAG TPA: hypothetical protein VGF86_06655 [Candidatus Tumulicola sp.]|jgi:hypothetical protein